MVRYTAEAGRDGGLVLTLTGHAEGSPGVCAAVSGLLWALTAYLAEDPAAAVRERVLDSGRAVFRFTGDDRTLGAFALVRSGLDLLARSYPDSICKEVSKDDA